VAVQFRIDDEEQVSVGHYRQGHFEVRASEAARLIMTATDPRGYEVLIPRRIEPREITRVRRVRQVVGWRFWPDAHGTTPCPWPCCLQKGEYGAAKIRRRLIEPG
jgi:hypothetical protein